MATSKDGITATTTDVISSTLATGITTTNGPTFVSIFNRDTYYPIYKRLCVNLEVLDIIRLSRTCKDFESLYRDLLAGASNHILRLHLFNLV